MLTNFQNFCTVGKRMKFATKLTAHYPSHLRHVATLPWEIKNAIFFRYSLHMKENANKLHFYRLYLCYSSTNFDRPIFSVKNSEFSSYCLQIKFSMLLFFFTYLFLRSVRVTGNSSQQTSLKNHLWRFGRL